MKKKQIRNNRKKEQTKNQNNKYQKTNSKYVIIDT